MTHSGVDAAPQSESTSSLLILCVSHVPLKMLNPSQSRKSQRDVEMAEEGAAGVRELRAAHAETILELEKTRKILSMESKICKDYKVVGAPARFPFVYAESD